MSKRILSAVLAAVLLLSGCTSGSVEANSNVREISLFSNLCNNGELTVSNDGKAMFTDFTNLNSSYLCTRPNCLHNDPKTCSAYGMGRCPFIYGNKIYYFEVETEIDYDGIIFDTTYIYTADLDGNNRQRIYTADHVSACDYTAMYLAEGKLYFSMAKLGYSEYGTTNYDEMLLCRYDFDSNTLETLRSFGTNWSSGIYIAGVFDGSVYFIYSYSEEEIVVTPDTMGQNGARNFEYMNLRYDIETEEFYDWDKSDFSDISDGYYITEKDGTLTFLDESGKSVSANLEGGKGIDGVVNGIAFSAYYGFCIDLSNGQTYALSTYDDTGEKRYEVVDFVEEKYILRCIDYSTGKTTYSAMTKDELIKEKL